MVETISSTGGREVIASGIGITYSASADYDIELIFPDGFKFTVRLKFTEQASSDKPELKLHAEETLGQIELECINFDDVIGVGTTQPVKLARWQGKAVSMNIWVRTPAEKMNREVRYCFYLGGLANE